MSGSHPVVEKQLVGHVDNSAYPLLDVDIQMTLVTPADAPGPVPVMMMFGNPAFFRRMVSFMAAHGGMAAVTGGDPLATDQLIADGWGYAFIDPTSIQADNGAGLTKGIIGLVDKGQPRKPDDWGALRAWGWGASRGLDYLETDPAVDAKHVGIEGVSRYGKAALVTMAFDTRFALVLVGSSGEGGAKLNRRNWGEAVESLTGSGEYHWMAGNFLKYGASEATFGSKNAGDLPVDSHELIALCAPRLTFISYGVPEKGDAKWLDQQGSFMAAVAAQPVFRLLGAKDLGVPDDYRTAKMPPVNTGLLEGQLAWRQHDGGHTDGPNWKYFIAWADKFIGHQPPALLMAPPRRSPLRKCGVPPINPLPAPTITPSSPMSSYWRKPGKAASTSISKAIPSPGAGERPIIPSCWPTGSGTSSAGMQPISAGAPIGSRTSFGVSIMANWTESIRRSSSCSPAPITSAIPCPQGAMRAKSRISPVGFKQSCA